MADMEISEAPTSSSSEPGGHRDIPKAQFVEDVEQFLAGREVDSVIRSLTERLQQYKLAETRMMAQKREIQAKLPDIKKSLEIVQTLQARQGSGDETTVDFELTEGIFAQAIVKDPSAVGLWLGANVMLEYSLDEALALLLRNSETADNSLVNLQNDILFLRDQVNITEVTIARVFNWDVGQKRLKKQIEKEP